MNPLKFQKGALMDEQVAIERKKPVQEIGETSEFRGNNSSCITRRQRRRKLSGHGSPGEKALLNRKPAWLGNHKSQMRLLNSCLCSLDEVVATPAINVNVMESACNKNFFAGINGSQYVAVIDGGLLSLGLFSVSIGIYVTKYCKLREIERNSNYFYFNRLFKTFNEEEIINKMGEIEQDNSNPVKITYDHLRAATRFYPPNISEVVCLKRRFFASEKEREQLKKLNELLEKKSTATFFCSWLSKLVCWIRRFFASGKKRERLKKSKDKEMLDKLHKKSLDQLCQFLNRETKLENFETQGQINNWSIGLAPNYKKDFFNYLHDQIKKHSKNTLEENKHKKNKNFIPLILGALGQASFIYWILIFIFYFIPIAPIIASISVIPLSIVLCGVLPFLLFYEVKKIYQIDPQKSMTEEQIEAQHKQLLNKKLLKLNKQKIFLDCLKNKNVNSSELNGSLLMKDLKKVIKNRHFVKYYAICMGFLDGCFLPLFVGWVLLDGIKVILTYALCPATVPLVSFTPIGLIGTAILVGITLFIGISYGIYSAYKANQVHEAKFKDLKCKIDALEQEAPSKEVLNKSLRDYDRLLRRFSDELPIWTNIKKGLNRFLIIIKRLGTGSLVFRLVMWGPITAIYAAVVASTAVPAFFPIILIIGTAVSAFVLASWYLFSYNLESKAIQAGNIVEHLVQSEQLAWINKQLSMIPLSEKCLNLQESSTEIPVSSENLIRPKNDTQFKNTQSLQKTDLSSTENIGSDKVDAATTQTRIQINGNCSHLQKMFINVAPFLENSENMEDCCSTQAVISC